MLRISTLTKAMELYEASVKAISISIPDKVQNTQANNEVMRPLIRKNGKATKVREDSSMIFL